VAVRGRMFTNPRCTRLLNALWQHSVVTGFFAKEIARVRRRNVDVAFLCGLLHDAGKAVLLDNIDLAGAGDAAIDEPVLVTALAEQHAAAGAVLASQWRLPEQIAEAMQFHHESSR